VGTSAGKLAEYRRRLRVAAATVLAVRMLAAAAGAGLVSFVLIAWVLGPMTPTVWLAVGWATVFAIVAGAVAWSIKPLFRLGGHGALGLVAQGEPALLSPLQTAYELRDADGFSRELVVAQRVGVLRTLEGSPARRFIPWNWLAQPALAAVVVMAAVAWWSLGFDRVEAGRYALLHSERTVIEGARTSHVVGYTSAELLFPEYMGRQNAPAADADQLVVPRGTAVEYSIGPIGNAARVVVELPGRHVEADRAGDQFVASFVADTDGPFEIFVESTGGERLVDYRARTIRVEVDQPPEVRLSRPAKDLVAEERQAILVQYSAGDDYGVQELTLIIKLPSGEHLRRPLVTTAEPMQRDAFGETVIRLEEFSLAPADAVTIWLEAKDANRVDGPGVGRSLERTLTLASDITRRRDRIAELEQLLDSLLATLAYRLEKPLPKPYEEASRRRLSASGFYQRIVGLLANVGDHPGPRTVALLLDMRKRLARMHQREAVAYRSAELANNRLRSDKMIVQELEKDTLIVADLISEARLNDAAEIAREMQQLRSEIASLIGELRRGQTPELQRALMAALDRAERRMQALQEQLRQAMQYVPGEFVNRQARQASTSTDALRDVREALAKGDLDAAEAALTRLDQMIESMTQALAQSEDSLVEAKFGPRERALMEAMDTIRDLEVEQKRMADKARRVGDRALERAAGGDGAMGSEMREDLNEIAGDVSQMLRDINGSALGPYESSLRTRAEERLKDFGKALESGDVGEAMSMADRVAQASNALAKDLELSAMMYRGRNGRTAEAATKAREAAARAQDLQNAARGAVPDVSGALTDKEQEQLGEQSGAQRMARQAAHDLARRLREEVGGVPVSEQTAEQLEAIERPMDRAANALEQGDPVEAHKQQQAAADQLRRLRQNLESQQKNTSAGQGGKESGRGSKKDKRVEIPTGRSKADEMAWRRRVLDAMNGRPPAGYEKAVDDYYERLLR
jgi:predicted translin family RNA/ssDNA-binding protein